LQGDNAPLPFLPGVAGYNVIQAAAPDGVNGTISNSATDLNITGALVRLSEPNLNLEEIAQDPCVPSMHKNTLKAIGRGAVTSLKKGQQQQTIEGLLKPHRSLDTQSISKPLPTSIGQTPCHKPMPSIVSAQPAERLSWVP